MPSPIAHAVSGYAIAKGVNPLSRMWHVAFYAVFVAIAADFDFIPQLVTSVNTHRGFTHSLGFALLFSGVVSAVIARRTSFKYRPTLLLTLTLYGSHLLLDFLTQGGTGIPLLWPISDSHFQSTIVLFPAVHHSHGLFDSIHVRFLSFELIYTVVLLWGISQWTSYKHQRRKQTLNDENRMPL
ncbi:metal-dependent hydrolase [Leptolyngbya cf. ectocarpi LEGE 11479]|uniref:Metal-dependent hydrolase n=1 Tax=Leptolyngbya cf. ectocarpi LEGE 11479 TaxID=1828722 RepID=A0A929FBD2_LEPEC|nr:metal-dependent hydrolase [Leptolyngbya ectocarpi]MBE9069022.1 metal-dependent hydrolase [Leptolyngbya cf. ectocarpi LEGE 11479]